MTTSAIVGIIATAVRLIPSQFSYGRGWEAWLNWLADNAAVFAGTALLTYIGLSIWQFADYKKFTNFRKICEKKWQNFTEEMTRED